MLQVSGHGEAQEFPLQDGVTRPLRWLIPRDLTKQHDRTPSSSAVRSREEVPDVVSLSKLTFQEISALFQHVLQLISSKVQTRDIFYIFTQNSDELFPILSG